MYVSRHFSWKQAVEMKNYYHSISVVILLIVEHLWSAVYHVKILLTFHTIAEVSSGETQPNNQREIRNWIHHQTGLIGEIAYIYNLIAHISFHIFWADFLITSCKNRNSQLYKRRKYIHVFKPDIRVCMITSGNDYIQQKFHIQLGAKYFCIFSPPTAVWVNFFSPQMLLWRGIKCDL